MEFLYKLYSNNYFGIGLFIVITVLAFSFLIILFFGKKDEKARNNQMVNKVEKNAEMLNELEEKEVSITEQKLETKTNSLEDISLEPAVIKEASSIPIEEEGLGLNTSDIEKYTPIPEDDVKPREGREEFETFTTDTENPIYREEYSLNQETPFILERSIAEEPVYQTPIYEEQINVDNESIEDVLNKYDIEENTILEEEINSNTTDIINAKEDSDDLHIFPSASDLEREETKRTLSSTPFSSVYLSKEEETKAKEEVPYRTPTPTRPQFELPKMADLPKRNTNVQTTHENIINTTPTEKNEEKNNIFRDIEEDSYWVNK